jgi:hypothetical protein
MDRRISKRFGLVRINRDVKLAVFTERNGSETTVKFGRFLSIRIEPVFTPKGRFWRAVLRGIDGNLAIDSGFSHRGVVGWVSPVAEWLQVPIETSQEGIDVFAWTSSSNRWTNPYP